MLVEHEMFEKFGGGELSKQGHIVETIPCQVTMLIRIAMSSGILHFLNECHS